MESTQILLMASDKRVVAKAENTFRLRSNVVLCHILPLGACFIHDMIDNYSCMDALGIPCRID